MDSEKPCCFEDCDDGCQDIVALKIFDQCKIQDCETLGPVFSREKCECVILPSCDENANLGRIILPGCPITAPQCTAYVKMIKNSFCLTKVHIANISPSPLRKGYWCADIIYSFDFTLQLFDMNMRPLKIVCCPTTFDEIKKKQKEKLFIRAGICFQKQVMLYGGEKAPAEVFSNIFCESMKFNDPYFLVQANAYPLSESLKDPCCLEDDCNLIYPPKCGCCNPCCDAYCEPFFYIFVEICLEGIIKLVRFTCKEIHAKSCTEPKECKCCSEDPCKLFKEMKFPNDLFCSK